MSNPPLSMHKGFCKYFEHFSRNGMPELPMPADANKGKAPAFPHKEGSNYDAKALDIYENPEKWGAWFERHGHQLNVLLTDWYVIDCDSPEALKFVEEHLATQFPHDFNNCPMQETRKGMHFVFLRPTNCDHYYTANAMGFTPQVGGTKLPIDIITVTSTGTRGNLNVWPSKNKRWVEGRSIFDISPEPLSQELYIYLDEHFIGKRASVPSQPTQPKKARQLQSKATPQTAARERVALGARQQLYTQFIINNCQIDGQPSVQ